MVGGQAADMEMEGNLINHHLVEFIHTHKTGALITASVSAGAILGGGSEKEIDAIASYGKKIGLAFQVSDDILDIEGDSLEMGKPAGSDLEKRKNTYPSVYGMEKSREILCELVDAAILSLKDFDMKADPLRRIAKYIIERKS
jgi:geranylgeranyl diphosphate synthase type II